MNNYQIGYTERVNFIDVETFIKSKDKFLPISVSANINVEQILYFRNWPLLKISGFQDQVSKGIIMREFTLSNFNIDELRKNWSRIDSVNSLRTKPFITIGITICARFP